MEDLIRRELSQLLPDRHSAHAGVVNDRDGRTAGDHEVLIRNRLWAPEVKLGATPESRRSHYPIESIYSAMEIKQTIGYSELDQAMGKLVRLSRLNQPDNPYGHITDNQHITKLDREGFILNPLLTVVLGTRMQQGITFRDVAMRFGHINAELSRDEMLRELCVFDEAVAMYMVQHDSSSFAEAEFMRDRQGKLVMAVYGQEPDKAFYLLLIHTLGHLTRSVLQVYDLQRHYGDLSLYLICPVGECQVQL